MKVGIMRVLKELSREGYSVQIKDLPGKTDARIDYLSKVVEIDPDKIRSKNLKGVLTHELIHAKLKLETRSVQEIKEELLVIYLQYYLFNYLDEDYLRILEEEAKKLGLTNKFRNWVTLAKQKAKKLSKRIVVFSEDENI